MGMPMGMPSRMGINMPMVPTTNTMNQPIRVSEMALAPVMTG